MLYATKVFTTENELARVVQNYHCVIYRETKSLKYIFWFSGFEHTPLALAKLEFGYFVNSFLFVFFIRTIESDQFYLTNQNWPWIIYCADNQCFNGDDFCFYMWQLQYNTPNMYMYIISRLHTVTEWPESVVKPNLSGLMLNDFYG